MTARVSIEDSGGQAADPGEVTLAVEDPSGNVDVYTYGAGEVIRSAVGRFYMDFVADEAGDWTVLWRTSGGGPTVTVCDSFTALAACLTLP